MTISERATIELEALQLEVDGHTASITLAVDAGESVALVGPHQPLLTAIVRAVSGLDPVQGGRVRVAGVDIAAANRHQLLRLRRRVGYVSVGGGLFANMTLLDNLTLPLRYHGISDSDAAARGHAMLREARLDALAHTRAASVSAELQKLAAYARALVGEPAVVLVEDPAAHLHPEGREIVARLHDRLRERGATVLVADDDLALAQRLAQRIVPIEGVSG